MDQFSYLQLEKKAVKSREKKGDPAVWDWWT